MSSWQERRVMIETHEQHLHAESQVPILEYVSM